MHKVSFFKRKFIQVYRHSTRLQIGPDGCVCVRSLSVCVSTYSYVDQFTIRNYYLIEIDWFIQLIGLEWSLVQDLFDMMPIVLCSIIDAIV